MKFPKREEGQGLVEYALVLVLVAIVVILIVQLLGTAVTVVFARVLAGLNGQMLNGVGTEYLVSGADITSVGVAGSCDVILTNVTVVAFQDGTALSNASVSVPVTAPGGSSTLTGTTDSNGVATGLGTTFSAACSGTVTIGNFSKGY